MTAPSRIDPLESYPGYLLRRISAAAMTELATRLAGLALRPTEASVLLVIHENPGITQSEIGRLLDIASANMAPLAGRLRKRELTLRTRVDGRSQGLSLSSAGRRLALQVRAVVRQHESDLLAKIPEPQRKALVDALRALWTPSKA
jgi:DNA-binding MarR family transcriptional regulator